MASISLNNNYEGIVSKSWNKGCHHLTTFPFPGTICAAALLSLKQMQKPEQHVRKSSGRHRCVFTQSVIPVVGAFLSEEGQGWNFFPTHTGRRPESVANRQFIPHPPPINIQCSKCVWTQRLQDGIFSRGPIGKGHHEVMEKPLPSL